MAAVARQREAGCGVMGTKAGMTTVFTPEGLAVPCTVIALEEGNIVSQVCALHGNIAPCICLDAA